MFWGLIHALVLVTVSCSADDGRPNIVILFTDDMGYGDLGRYGHPTIKTPNIDRLADQGIRFTSFLTGNYCVPSRTQLITGRYMPRVKFGGATGANGKGGMPEKELTLAEGLQKAGYNTGMIGKWHLGHIKKKFLPPNQGFDSWFGMPYSNDFKRPWVQTDRPLGLFRGTEMVEHPINQDSLTVRYTAEAVDFIEEKSERASPFFLYLAYNMPHLPLHTTDRFRGRSAAGLYGDVIETIDWSVREVLQALEKKGVSETTIVFFASDNGPWLDLPKRMLQAGNKSWHVGSPGPLRGSKGTTYEGGHRVPAILRWPGQVESGRVTDELAASPDIYRTLLEAGGADLPDHTIDGYNLLPFLKGEVDDSPRDEYYYFRHNKLEAIRQGPWKLSRAGKKPQLFNLQEDPGERHNRAAEHPEKVKRLKKEMLEVTEKVAGKQGEASN